MKPRSAKAKGTKLEKKVAEIFNRFGWSARRQPGSGIYQGFPHDVEATSPSGKRYVVEAKKWKNGWRTGDKAMGQADILIMERDYGEPMAYLSLATLGEIANEEPPE